jgi:membrane protease YdiL (CAAX protease family)
MPTPRTALRQSVVFVTLVFAIVLGTALALPHAPGRLTPLLTMQTPVLVVLLLSLLTTPRGHRRGLWRTLGLRTLGLRSWPAALAVPVLGVLLVPYAVALALGSADLVAWTASVGFVGGLAVNLVVGIATLTVLALGEEIGWRGYLLPRVQTLVPRRWAAVVVGFVHGLFHLPLILLTTTYDSVGSRWVVAPMVVLIVTAAGVLYAWLRDRSGSVWPVALAHATVNVVLDGAGLVVAVTPVALAYTAGESGVATLAAVVGLAALLLVRGSTWRQRTPAASVLPRATVTAR